jgi:hypothetical protein
MGRGTRGAELGFKKWANREGEGRVQYPCVTHSLNTGLGQGVLCG